MLVYPLFNFSSKKMQSLKTKIKKNVKKPLRYFEQFSLITAKHYLSLIKISKNFLLEKKNIVINANLLEGELVFSEKISLAKKNSIK